MSAYACSPYQGSEPGVGWGFVAALARHHDLWVIVEEEKYRADIERYLSEHAEFSRHAHFIFIRKKRRRLLRKIWPPSYYWDYRDWHYDALQLAEEMHKEVSFDIAHQLTMVGFREPGYLWNMSIPFVWGPIGGMGTFPWRFLTAVGLYGAIYYAGYNLINLLQMRFLRRPKLAAKIADSGLIVATAENQRGAQKSFGCAGTLLSEVGLPPQKLTSQIRRDLHSPLRIVWAGNHVPGKALNLGLLALASLGNETNWILNILGQGVRTNHWKLLANKLNIDGRCHFHGWLARNDALSIMRTSHVLLITSLRDLTSTVTVEALMLGVPIICLDHCGFGGALDESCSIKIPVTTPKKVVVEIATAIRRLDDDEEFRTRLAKGALRKAEEFSWDRKVEIVNQIYRQKLGELAESQK